MGMFKRLLEGNEMLGKCVVCDEYSVSIDNGNVSCFGCKGERERSDEVEMSEEEFDKFYDEIMVEVEERKVEKKVRMEGNEDLMWMMIYRRFDCNELEVSYMSRDREKVWNRIMKYVSDYLGEGVGLGLSNSGDEIKIEIVKYYWVKFEGFEFVLKYYELEDKVDIW